MMVKTIMQIPRELRLPILLSSQKALHLLKSFPNRGLVSVDGIGLYSTKNHHFFMELKIPIPPPLICSI